MKVTEIQVLERAIKDAMKPNVEILEKYSKVYIVGADGNLYWQNGDKKKDWISYGYRYIKPYNKDKGKHERVSVHRLVAYVHVPNPNNYPQVNHIDGNKLNNRADNLEWCTPSQNAFHAVKHKLFVAKSGEDSGQSKLTWDKVREIRRRKALGETDAVVCKDFGVCHQTISLISRGVTWRE